MDDALKLTGKVVGPLHGLPISLKDQFTMKGLETIMGKRSRSLVRRLTKKSTSRTGYVSWIGEYADSDCVLVEILYECGAVPFCRTNVPQASPSQA